jgi:hypothetical protein
VESSSLIRISKNNMLVTWVVDSRMLKLKKTILDKKNPFLLTAAIWVPTIFVNWVLSGKLSTNITFNFH